MTFFVKAEAAPAPRTPTSRMIALFYAGVLTVMAVAQLFTLDEFVELFFRFDLPVGTAIACALAPIIIASEIFALPFLLGMKVSPLFRWLSMALGWLVAFLWLFVSISVVVLRPLVDTVGFLGTALMMPIGYWAIGFSLLFAIMTVWASWGLWPGQLKLPKRR